MSKYPPRPSKAMERMEILRRLVPALPPDLLEVLEWVLEDDVVTDDERIAFLHALTGQPVHPLHKGILRDAIEHWARSDAGELSPWAFT